MGRKEKTATAGKNGRAKRVGRGAVGPAKVRALELAHAQVDDETVAKVLRSEFSTEEPYAILRTHLEHHLGMWIKDGMLSDARAAGVVYVQETLYKKATAGKEVAAAIHIVRRREQLEGLDLGVQRELERLLKLEASDLEGELSALRKRLGEE